MKKALSLHIALLTVGAPSMALAASFQLLEQSPAQMGKAFAGTASDISDASTVYFNPAGMTRLDRASFTLGGNLISTEADFANGGSSYTTIAGNTVPVEGSGRTEEDGFIPNAYLVLPLSEGFSVGLGAGGPFGLSSDFGTVWPGRYSATFSEMEVMNINATVAWAPSDMFSMGLGINYQRIDVTLQSQVDSSLGLNPDPGTDSSALVEGDDDGYALDASILFTPTRYTNIGLLWREGGDFTLEGAASFDLNAACAPGAGFPTGAPPAPTTGTLCAGALGALAGDVVADVKLPDVITLSASHWFTERWALHADISQTRWSSIQSVDVVNVENGASVDELELNYDDTLRYALGASVKTTDAVTWRFGVAFDEAPQTDPEYVSPRIPDADRTWLAAGVNLKFTDSLSMDISYAHLMVDDAELDRQETTATGGSYNLSGQFDSKVNIIAGQLNWHF